MNKGSSVMHVEVTRTEVDTAQASGDLHSRYSVPGTMQVHHVVSPVPGYICTRGTACCNSCCMSETGEPLLTCNGWNAHLLNPELSNKKSVNPCLKNLANRLCTRANVRPKTTLSQRRKGSSHMCRHRRKVERSTTTRRTKRNPHVRQQKNNNGQ